MKAATRLPLTDALHRSAPPSTSFPIQNSVPLDSTATSSGAKQPNSGPGILRRSGCCQSSSTRSRLAATRLPLCGTFTSCTEATTSHHRQLPKLRDSSAFAIPMGSNRACSAALSRLCRLSGGQALASLGYLWATVSDIVGGPLTPSRIQGIIYRNYFQSTSPAPHQRQAVSLSRSEDSRNVSTSATLSGTPEVHQDGPWLIVGLGNPGPKYEGTRHNVGFEIVDALAAAEGISLGSMQCKAAVGKGRICGTPVVLAKPQTFMNLSGESVAPLARFYKIPPARVLVMYDDLDLDVASMKLLAKGGHGGHNGMRSMIERFGGNKNFPRLRFGIGRPPGKMETKVYVLLKFTRDEREEVDVSIQRAVDGIRLVMSQGLDRAVSQWNQSKKQPARVM